MSARSERELVEAAQRYGEAKGAHQRQREIMEKLVELQRLNSKCGVGYARDIAGTTIERVIHDVTAIPLPALPPPLQPEPYTGWSCAGCGSKAVPVDSGICRECGRAQDGHPLPPQPPDWGRPPQPEREEPEMSESPADAGTRVSRAHKALMQHESKWIADYRRAQSEGYSSGDAGLIAGWCVRDREGPLGVQPEREVNLEGAIMGATEGERKRLSVLLHKELAYPTESHLSFGLLKAIKIIEGKDTPGANAPDRQVLAIIGPCSPAELMRQLQELVEQERRPS